jgi:predicted secreted protein
MARLPLARRARRLALGLERRHPHAPLGLGRMTWSFRLRPSLLLARASDPLMPQRRGVPRMFRLVGPMILALTLALSAAHADGPPPWTVLTLTESAQRAVAADRLVAQLRLEEQGEDARAVQAAINRRMGEALERARAEPEVRVEGGGYAVTSSMPPPEQRARPVWTAVQEPTLEGADPGKVLALAGALQDMGFLFSELRQELSPERQRQERESLLREASARLRATAEALADSLELRFVGWSRVSLVGGLEPRRFARAAMMADEMEAPSTATADITVTVTVEGEARLLAVP